MLVGRTDAGSEVVGAPHVWDVHSNWKFCADNFTGDNFHLYTAHGSVVQLGMLPPDPMSLAYGTLNSGARRTRAPHGSWTADPGG